MFFLFGLKPTFSIDAYRFQEHQGLLIIAHVTHLDESVLRPYSPIEKYALVLYRALPQVLQQLKPYVF